MEKITIYVIIKFRKYSNELELFPFVFNELIEAKNMIVRMTSNRCLITYKNNVFYDSFSKKYFYIKEIELEKIRGGNE